MSLNTGNAILSNAITVDSTYKVGIGTSSPYVKLDVLAASGATDAAYFKTSDFVPASTGSRFGIGFSSATGNAATVLTATATGQNTWSDFQYKSLNHLFYVSNSEVMRITSAGNVGIGTTSPAVKLDILTTTSSSADSTGLRLLNNSGENVGNIDFDNLFGNLARITGSKMAGGSLADDGMIAFSTASNSVLSEKMRITNAGNIGIGTSTVTEGTQASGSISIFPVSSVSSAPLIQFPGNGRIRPASSGDRLSIEGNSLFLNPTFFTDVVIGGTGNYGSQTLSIRNAWSGGSYSQISFYTGVGNCTIRSNIPGNSTNGLQFLTYWSNNGDKVAATFDGFGNVYNYNNTTGWQQTSDARVKENIKGIENALNMISLLKPVTFDYKQPFADKNNWDENKKLNNIGFIAQDFEEVFPKYVHSNEDIIGDEKIEDFKSIDTGHLIPILVKAIQELNQTIQNQQQQINQLINK